LKIDEGNVARVEFPRWVAEPPGWLDRLHALLTSQIEKGGGYPVALMEAHEQAVVRGSERDLFYQLLEERMTARGWQPRRSAKNLSKSRPLV
jgi:NurA-like 5'-3' nuclease